MSEYRKDPLADAVFRTPAGKAAQIGIFTGSIAAVPVFFVEIPNAEIRLEESRIRDLERQQDTLLDGAKILEDRGINDLASQIQVQSDTLGAEISSAKEAIPPHLAGDVATGLIIAAPFIIGSLAGVVAYKNLKKRSN